MVVLLEAPRAPEVLEAQARKRALSVRARRALAEVAPTLLDPPSPSTRLLAPERVAALFDGLDQTAPAQTSPPAQSVPEAESGLASGCLHSQPDPLQSPSPQPEPEAPTAPAPECLAPEDRRLLREWLDRPGRGYRDEQWSTLRPRHLAPGEVEPEHARRNYGSGRERDTDPEDPGEPDLEDVELEVPLHFRERGRDAKPRLLVRGEYAHGSKAPPEEFQRRFGSEEPYRGPRPATRGACAGGQRPCPFVSCSMNNYLEVTPSGGIGLSQPDLDPHEVHPDYSCALDVAERGRHSLDGVGRILSLSHERVRQIQEDALEKLRRVPAIAEVLKAG